MISKQKANTIFSSPYGLQVFFGLVAIIVLSILHLYLREGIDIYDTWVLFYFAILFPLFITGVWCLITLFKPSKAAYWPIHLFFISYFGYLYFLGIWWTFSSVIHLISLVLLWLAIITSLEETLNVPTNRVYRTMNKLLERIR